MSKNTADNKESFDIDFSDLLVQDLPVDTKKIDNTDTGLSADDLSFLESLSQFPEAPPAPTEPKAEPKAEPKLEPAKADNKPEAPKTVLHPSLMDNKVQADVLPMDNKADKTSKDAIDELLAPPPAKKAGLFGGKGKDTKDKKGKKDDSPFAKAPSKKPAGKKDLKKQLTLILGAMGVILVLGLLWVFLGKSEEPAPAPEPTPVETQAPAPEPTPEATETPETPVDTAGTTEGATAENTATPAPTGDFAPIDADAIVQAEIPDDPALIKEEIDRLADENSRLLDQAKDIDGILSDTEKLTSAKEEQIALLEAQIAQLEAQKGK